MRDLTLTFHMMAVRMLGIEWRSTQMPHGDVQYVHIYRYAVRGAAINVLNQFLCLCYMPRDVWPLLIL